MKQMSQSKLNERINKFKDRHRSKMFDMNELSDVKVRHSPRHLVEVSGTPFIALAIK